MKATVREMNENRVVIEFNTSMGIKNLTLEATSIGYKYEDFAEWEITDEEYYKIEDMVGKIADQWESTDEIIYDLD